LINRGQAKLFINDKLVVANVENQKLGDLFFGTGTIEEKGTIKLEAGKTYDLRMDWSNFKPVDYTAPNPGFGAFRIGALPYVESSKAVNEAVDLAKNSDSVVIITGLNADYESEGFDRPDMK
jgi:beta-glucosidase